MNQILVTQKLYVTPELKKKKKLYKFNFMISIFLITVLFSVYIYAEYDRNKSEEIAQEILDNVQISEVEDPTTLDRQDKRWVFILNSSEDSSIDEEAAMPVVYMEDEEEKTNAADRYIATYEAPNGKTYNMVGRITIPSIDVNYAILSETTDALLKVSVCKFWGADPNEVGNLCIAGHNYRNRKFFSKVQNLAVGDIIEITDLSERTLQYKVFDKYTVDPTDVSCTSQITNGKKIVTLITCTDDSKQRIIVKAVEK